jgi:hypothetical protein
VAERDPEVIKAEIAAARDRLALTVDSLAVRASPQRVAEDAKATALEFLNQTKVKAVLVGVGVLVLIGVVRSLRR